MMRLIAVAGFVVPVATSAQVICPLGWTRSGPICLAPATVQLSPLHDDVPSDAPSYYDYVPTAPACHRSEQIVRVPRSKGRGTREIKIIRCP
jgi:hypothetical protein